MAEPRSADHYRRELRKTRGHLRDLVRATEAGLKAIDAVMRGPATSDRGKQIAAIVNQLDMAKDAARHFGLGESLRPRSDGRRP